MSSDTDKDLFFRRIAAYYDARGWERPGTAEQFEQTVSECWDLELMTADDGERYFLVSQDPR
jgi:hypothetical protein